MNDQELKMIYARSDEEFESKVNELLARKQWRVAQAEMSCSDNYYVAMMIRSDPENAAMRKAK